MKKFALVSLISVFVVSAMGASSSPSDIDPLSLEVTLIDEGPFVDHNFLVTEYLDRSECVPRTERFEISELISLGQQLWQIVKDGAPVVNFNSFSSSAIPQAAACPFAMAGWSIPQSKTYKLSYKNLFGSEVVSFTYKLIYSYGGTFEGRGAYLANVSVHPADIYASWGQNFNASVSIANVINVGTAADPVAGMQVILEWSVGNVINKFTSQRIYFVDGRGQTTEL